MVLRRYMALLLLCVTSFHVLVTDVASHERVPVRDGQELTAALDQPDQNAGAEHHGGAQHCCQCHGFMASPPSSRAPGRPCRYWRTAGHLLCRCRPFLTVPASHRLTPDIAFVHGNRYRR